MKRFFGEKHDENIIISGSEFDHLKKVLRMKEGEEVVACLNDEFDYYCVIEKLNKNDAVLKILDKKVCKALPKKDITLFQMIPKKEYLDSIIAKSIELGVNKIVPFISEYTLVRQLKMERINMQIKTACKQCERSKLIEFSQPVKFDDLPKMLKEYDLVIFAYEKSNTPFDPEILKNKNKIAIIIGNEAGFSEKEGEILSKCSTVISLGERILRCDTAVVATLSIVSLLSGN